jgi:flagellar protein FlaG
MAIQQISSLAPATTSQAVVVSPSQPAQASEAAPAQAPQAPLPLHPETSSAEQMQMAVAEIRKAIAPVARNLQFSIDKETGKTIVRIVDAETNEVIRQIPGDEVIAIARAIDRMQGLLIKQKA